MTQRLSDLRNALVDLHKTLVDSERISYEQTVGPITSPGQMLQLLTNDPWFAWLHPLSLLIVTMDHAIDSKRNPPTRAHIEALIRQARELLVASEEGDDFPRHYHDALQRDPDVVLAHASVAKQFGRRQ
jgi:hypothetical protein